MADTATQDRAAGKVKNQRLRKEIGKKHRELREGHTDEHGKSMSMQALADTLTKKDGQKWHFTYIGNVERGQVSPSQEYVRAAAEFFGVEPQSMLPDQVKLEDLTEGVTRAPRRSRRQTGQTRGSRTSAAPASEEATTPARRTPSRSASNGNGDNGGDLMGLSLSEDGTLTLVTGKNTFTIKGEFDAQIVNGRLRLAS